MASTPQSSSSSSSTYSCLTIIHMNEDQIFSILQLLPYDSILSFSMTCKKLRSLAISNSLWEFVCRRDWGTQSIDALLSSALLNRDRSSVTWIRVYKEISVVGSFSCDRLFSEDGILPMARASHSLNFVSGCLVLFGGGCEGGRHLEDAWITPINEKSQHNQGMAAIWRKVHLNTPTGRFGHTCTTIDPNTLILFGGINDNGIRQNDIWLGRISPGPDIPWRLLPNAGPTAPPPRGAHAACLSAPRRALVIHGGIGLSGLRLSDTWLLDLSDGPLSASWRPFPNLNPSPPARSGHSLTWIGGALMVLFGGRGSGYEVLNDLWVFNLEAARWMEIKYESLSSTAVDAPPPRVGHSANLMMGRKMLIYGGEDSQRQRKDDFWVLDVSALVKVYEMKVVWKRLWRRGKVERWMPGHRSFHGSCVDEAGRCVYVFGGMVDGVLQSGEAFGLRFDEELFMVELHLKL